MKIHRLELHLLLWFSVNGATGLYRVIGNSTCLRALNPWEGLKFIFNNPQGSVGFLALSSIFLSVTGLEALYADMDHFTAWLVRVAWMVFVLPSLILQYLGQAAVLLDHPEFVK